MKNHIYFTLGLIVGCIICLIIFPFGIREVLMLFIIIKLGYWGRVIIEKDETKS